MVSAFEGTQTGMTRGNADFSILGDDYHSRMRKLFMIVVLFI